MKSTYIVLTFVGTTLIAAGCSKTTTTQTPPPAMEKKQEAITMDADGGHETAETAAKEKMAFDKNNTSKTPATAMAAHGSYQDYSPETAKAEQAAGHKVVLFFHADWCPFCVEADKQFKAKLDQIPQGVTVLKTNYDTETALKKKYAVTYQHTFVQIDAEGNLSSKWNSGDIDNLKKNLK